MKSEEYNKFKSVIAGMCEVYDRVPSEVLLKVFWEDFKDFTIEEFSKAVSDHRKDPDQGMFFPKTAHLMKQLKGNSKDQQRSIEGKAELAWSEITAHLQYHGPYKTFKSNDGVALAAFHAVGGMSKLSTADYEKMTWIKKEFISMYETYENTPIENLPQNIMGLEDLHRHKLEQKGQMSEILTIANEMINSESEEKQTPEESFETGKRNIGGLKAILGKPEKRSEPTAKESSVKKSDGVSGVLSVNVTDDTEKERERRRQALEDAKQKLNRGEK